MQTHPQIFEWHIEEYRHSGEGFHASMLADPGSTDTILTAAAPEMLMTRSLRLPTAALLLLASMPAVAEEAPDFTLRKAPQFTEEVSLSSHRGQVVIVNFWATWCAPCLAEMDAFKSVYVAINDTNGDGKVDDEDKNEAGVLPLEVISISVDESRDRGKINSTIRPKQLPFTVVWDQGKKVSQVYNPNDALPYTVIVDQAGGIVERIEEYAQGEECHVLDKVAELLGRTDVVRPPQCAG
ncbi:MAG: peroxiredoxin [Myxococcota bacterium]|jgi:peroxiredoxin